MKSACRAVAFFAAGAGAFLSSRADDAKPVTLAPVPPSMQTQAMPVDAPLPPPDAEEPSAEESDPNAAIMHSAAMREQFLHESAVKGYQDQARQEAYDNDWMLRGYTAELKTQGLAADADNAAAASRQPPNPSTSMHELDPLLPPDPATSDAPPPKRPSPADSTTEAPVSDTPAPLFLAPLLPTMSESATQKGVTRLDAWGSTTTFESVPALNSNLPVLGNHEGNSPVDDETANSSLDVPGLTAAREDPDDLNLPDEKREAATENSGSRVRDTFLLPTAASNDSSEFFRRQSEALAAPNTPVRAVALTIPLGHAPPPPEVARKMPPTMGIRSHVDDPFDLIGGHRD